MRRFSPFLVALLLLVGCDGIGRSEGPQVTPSGPPEIDFALVRRHAEQFDVDLPNRPPGSQQEVAAATYILGHLQFAGYSPLLDAVPVKDQVQSSNVIAVPPTGVEPKVMVTVAYDTSGRGLDTGMGIGLFLELARAMNVAYPDHAVGFAALGAEEGDRRGSAALASFFDEQGLEPSVISMQLGRGERRVIVGSCAGSLTDLVPIEECAGGPARFDDDPFSAHGLQHTMVRGDPTGVGSILFRFLAGVAD
jgi:hypothetical protein